MTDEEIDAVMAPRGRASWRCRAGKMKLGIMRSAMLDLSARRGAMVEQLRWMRIAHEHFMRREAEMKKLRFGEGKGRSDYEPSAEICQ